MISIFLSKKKTDFATMQMRNGDIILEHCISAKVKMDRNAIWYLTIEVPESELLGYNITDESIFKVDLNFIKGQLFRMIYPKYNRIKRTYTFYASHIFFDVQYEVFWDKEPQWIKLTGSEVAPSSWEEAVNAFNNLINDYKIGGLELPYKLNGVAPIEEFTEGVPEDNRMFYIRWKKNPAWGVDVNNRSTTAGTNINLYTFNRSPAQRFYMLSESNSYKNIIYYFGNQALELYGVPDGSSLSDGNKIAINTISKGSSNQLWKITKVAETGGYKIAQKRDEKFCWDNNNGLTVNNNPIDMRSIDDSLFNKENKSWCFTYCDMYQYLEWNGKNLVECVFGTDDNAMCNAYPMVDETHTTAMLDNYNCFFGKMSEYPDSLKPRQIYLTDKEFTEFTETRSMENVLTGIIPKGSNGTVVDNDNTAQGAHYTRITKGPYWNNYEIKRIDEMTYDDISLNTDNPNSSEAFTTKSAYDAALRNAALMDLKKKKYCKPDVTVETQIIDLFRDSNPTVGDVKLNDELIYISDDGTRRLKFYFESLTYDVLMDRVTNAKLVEEMEVL